MALRRILKERTDAQKNCWDCISAGPISEEDPFIWQANFLGPEGTPYAGGLFFLKIQFPSEYPWKPMQVRFTTKIYHPNVDAQTGTVCQTPIMSNWSPAFTIAQVLTSIYTLLSAPNLNDSIAPDVRDLYQRDRSRFDQTAREWTLRYAT
jgi:ubiquitin-conjugating enzyme E2 D/E